MFKTFSMEIFGSSMRLMHVSSMGRFNMINESQGFSVLSKKLL